MKNLVLPLPSIAAIFLALMLGAQISRAQESPHGDLKQPCDDCHVTTSWKELATPLKFDHGTTEFPLVGQHAGLACAKCHDQLRFAGTASGCVDCHDDIHRGELGASCDRCHTPSTWLVPDMVQRHNSTRFPLVGAHMTVPCRACHVNQQKNEYVGVPTDCFGCHRAQYDATTAPPHRSSGFSADCLQCHAPTAITWGAGFNHARTAFPLTGAHGAVSCGQCHQGGRFRGVPLQCVSCHQSDADKVSSPKHTPPSFSSDCTTCHTTSIWKPSGFNHSTTRFPLTGAHVTASCASCHVNGVYAGTATNCLACHQQQFTSAVNPNHVTSGFPTECQTCHATTGWRPSTFDHARTQFALTGAHAAVACNQCHPNGRYQGSPLQCSGCHQADYNNAAAPKHTLPAFSPDCTVCHSTVAWKPSSFDHNKTQYPLTGGHAHAPCMSCHTGGVYAGTSTSCSSCHQADFTSALNPNHVTAGFPQDCGSCHTTAAWRPSSFDHNRTGFALTGAHAAVICKLCHVGDRFKGTPTQCVSCHQADYDRVTSPKHVLPGFSTDCTVCHTTAAWKPSSFSHGATRFPLTGAHTTTACSSCHVNGIYAGTAIACVGCHQQQFTSAVNPNHVTSGFPTDCERCHTTAAWRPSSFDHARTQFPLTGAHAAVQCSQCHPNSRYQGTPTHCSGCHLEQYNGVVSPRHVQPSFPLDCTLCHSTSAWKPSSFNHSTTSFLLTGAHVTASCASCHVNAIYAGTATACIGCHQQQFNAATNPNHVTSGFSTDCQTCHTTSAWRPATFDHNKTQFPLTGAHLAIPCTQCHVDGRYQGTPTQCSSCHQADYNAVVNPKHTQPSFSLDCTVCHSTSAWKPSSFNHGNTRFVLTGAHLSTPCVSCHAGGVYAGTAVACFGCHQQDYNGSVSPNHAAAGFPTDCQTCHSTTAWKPSSWNHDTYFPIGSGSKHSPGRWTVCADCHTVQTNFKAFSCVSCHEHNQADTDSKHREVSGYAYESAACYRCHPRGSE